MEGTALRRSLDEWFTAKTIRPVVRCEVGDCDLFEVFGHAGVGVFAVPNVLVNRIRRMFSVGLVGRADEIQEKYFAISTERKLKHPAVLAISKAARAQFEK
jgi:LysR family transcriptional activator of nhaA